MKALASFFRMKLQALAELVDPPTTTVVATVVGKQFGKVPLERPLFSEDSTLQPLAMIEVPMLTVTLPGVSGSRAIQVPPDLYRDAVVGMTIPVETRPSRIMENYVHVDYCSPAF